MNIDGIVCNGFSNPEVDDFQFSFDQDEICRFEIRVYDILVVYGLYGFQHLDQALKVLGYSRVLDRWAGLTCCQ